MLVKDIIVKDRHRKIFGDMEGLQQSIKENGLLQPIVVQKETNKLIAGERRLKALIALGYEELPKDFVRFISIGSILRGEFAENFDRLDLTRSEKYALSEDIREEIKKQAKERQKEAGVAGRDKEGNPIRASVKEIFPELKENPLKSRESEKDDPKNKGQTRDIVAEKLGMSGKTLEQIGTVVELARKNPKRFASIQAEMDSEEISVDKACKKAIAVSNKESKKNHGASKLLHELMTKDKESLDKKIPDFVMQAITYLTHPEQDKLVKAFGECLFLVKQVNFDRAVKYYAKGEHISTLDEKGIVQVLADVFGYTKEERSKWIFDEPLGTVASALNSAAAAENADIMDKLAFCTIAVAMAINLWSKVSQAAAKKNIFGDIPVKGLGDAGINFEQLEQIATASDASLKAVKQMYTSKLMNAIAFKVKQSGDNAGKKFSVLKAVEKIADIEDELSFQQKRIVNFLDKIGEK
ncbi:MAG: Nucleoid occlusion protein [Syntrophomonadaceae bacterium]|nr:Nucleoid occlusion protein [Bacillota bacterium]